MVRRRHLDIVQRDDHNYDERQFVGDHCRRAGDLRRQRVRSVRSEFLVAGQLGCGWIIQSDRIAFCGDLAKRQYRAELFRRPQRSAHVVGRSGVRRQHRKQYHRDLCGTVLFSAWCQRQRHRYTAGRPVRVSLFVRHNAERPRCKYALRCQDRKSTRLNSSHTVIYTLSLHDALPILSASKASIHSRAARACISLRPAQCRAASLQIRLTLSRSEEHTSELQSHSDLHSFPTRRSSDLVSVKGIDTQPGGPCVYLSSSGTMPSGLAANTPYVVTCNQSLGDGWNNQELAFSPTRGDAFNNNIIAISSTGSGTLTITPAIYLMPWLPIPLMDTDGHRVWALGTKPTLLSAPDFVYLTTKSRMMPPYLVGTPVDHNACLLQPYGTLGPDYLAPFSQGAFYEPANIGGYGETPISDRIGWLSHSQAVELYRPLDLEAVQFCRNAAWAWMELSPVLGDERYGGVHPVVNETQYSNYPTPVGPGVFWSTDSRNTFPVNKGSEVVNVDLGGAHNPCPHILPYLKTGDFLHYESLAYYCNARFLNSIWGAFTAGTVTAYKPWCCIAYPNNNYNPGGTIDATSFDSSNIVQGNWDYGDGIQVRGVGWMGRIQSVMTHFMPDNRPEAQYFRDMHRGIFTLPNQVTQYIPTEFANLGAWGAVVNNGYSNTYTVYGLYFHYIMFLCWAVEAWKGEYPDLVNFVCNYLSRGPLGIANDRWPPYGPGGQGCIFAGQLYHYVVADPTDSTRFGTWDQALANSYLSPVNQWDIGTISGSTVTSAHGVSSFANFQNSPTVFVNTLNFNDFPAYTQVAHGGEGGGTSFSLIPLEGSSGNAQAAVARSTYTAPTSVAAGVGATTLQFSASAFPGGVLVGMAACNQSNIASLPVGSLNVMNQGGAIIPSFVTAINSSGGTVTISLSEPIGQFSGQGINAGDTILFGPAIVFSLTPMPWPGVAAVATAGGVKDMGDNNFGANYYDARSYFCFLTSCLGMADTLFRQTGNANLAIASNAYTEIRRRQYLGFPPGINSPLAFNNNPRWGVGPIGATS